MIRNACIATAALVSTACSMTSPTLQETRELELTVSPETTFIVEAGSGSLSVQGEAGLEMIMVEAEIWQVTANENYTLTLEADGDERARLVADTDSGFGRNNDRIDLSIRVPNSLSLRVNDGSGSIRVRDLAGSIDIDDGSGSIDITQIGGDMTLDDGSGSIAIDNVDGSIRIDDGSGSITVAEVGGDVRIDDGSGSITARNIGGTVTVSDQSGSITVDGAADFELLDDGSGSVNLDNIRSRTDGD